MEKVTIFFSWNTGLAPNIATSAGAPNVNGTLALKTGMEGPPERSWRTATLRFVTRNLQCFWALLRDNL